MKISRILFVHSGSDLYGASRSLLRLSARLVRDGMIVLVVLPSEGPLVHALQEQGVTVQVQSSLPVIDRQRVRSIWGMLQLLVRFIFSSLALFRLIHRFKPDLIHSVTSVILSPGLVAKLAGVPHIWHVREFFGEFGPLWRFYQKYMIWFSTIILCVSTPVAEQFDLFPRSGKILVLHNGFPEGEFNCIPAGGVEQFREKYLPAGCTALVGVVGRIKYRRKGQEVFVQAAGLLQKRFPETHFLCIGSPYPGNEAHLVNLLQLVKELGLQRYVECTGDIEDIKSAIQGLDVLVLSSAQPEPFGGVVIEAMALGRPVVATRIGGSVEQVEDGVTGYLVEPGDPVSMAEAIGKLLESPQHRQSFGEKGRDRFLERFEFEPFYRKILDIYEQVVFRRRGA